MISNEVINQFDDLSKKYNFKKILIVKNEIFSEIDDLIKNINNYSTYSPKSKNKKNSYDNTIFIGERLLNFTKFNIQNGELFKCIEEQMSSKILELYLNRYYEYMFTKVKNTDSEIYNELKMITISNRYARRQLIKSFIDKWCFKEKKININL